MASKYLQKFPVSGAFPDLLHDFAREVLRDQPEDIYEYGAAYFKAMENVSVSQSFTRFQGVEFKYHPTQRQLPQGKERESSEASLKQPGTKTL